MNHWINLITQHGNLELTTFEHNDELCIVVRNGDYKGTPFVRIHSSCVFSESLGAIDCDCSRQLDASIEYIAKHGGIIIYLYEEGRGIGLKNKTMAIHLERERGISTAEAFRELGFNEDPRTYELPIRVLQELSIDRVILATNNPRKVDALMSVGILVEQRHPLAIEKNALIEEYLERKVEILGHHGND